MILYTFAAGKSYHLSQMSLSSDSSSNKQHLSSDVDMFAVIGDNDVGFGITSKTSLKVYNDPLGYFTFIKVFHPFL